jgi:hypothetical protein
VIGQTFLIVKLGVCPVIVESLSVCVFLSTEMRPAETFTIKRWLFAM